MGFFGLMTEDLKESMVVEESEERLKARYY